MIVTSDYDIALAEHQPWNYGGHIFNKIVKVRVHLGRTACDVQILEMCPLGVCHDRLDNLLAHYFRTVGSGFQVAMPASLVTEESHVDLKCVSLSSFEFKPVLDQGCCKWFD